VKTRDNISIIGKWLEESKYFTTVECNIFKSMFECECINVFLVTAEYLVSLNMLVGVTTHAAGPALTVSIAITVSQFIIYM